MIHAFLIGDGAAATACLPAPAGHRMDMGLESGCLSAL